MIDWKECECVSWATTDFGKLVHGNGHNPSCQFFVENYTKRVESLLIESLQLARWAPYSPDDAVLEYADKIEAEAKSIGVSINRPVPFRDP